ncbi:MAG: purine nucleoside permease [Pseudomonadota bacterium]
MAANPAQVPLKPKVLVITTYEYGVLGQSGSSGEAFHWYTNDKLTNFLNIPGTYPGGFDTATPAGSYEGIFYNDTGDECLIVTGMGQNNAGASLLALGFSDLVNLSETYLIVAGIAGGNPNHTTLGSVAWANWAVAGDLANLVPMSELPADTFLYPLFHLGCSTPWPTAASGNQGFTTGTEIFSLNQSLAKLAHAISQDAELGQQNASVKAYAGNYDQPAAAGPPAVLRGDSLASNFFFHGNQLGQWAEWWMRQWISDWIAGNTGEFQPGLYAMTVMEDIAFASAAQRLAQAGRIDYDRLMMLRGAGNFDRPYPGEFTIASLQESDAVEIAFDLALDNLYAAGSLVVKEIITSWEDWKDGLPTGS